MSNTNDAYIPPAALTGSVRDYRVPGGADLLGRTEGFFKWQNLRRQNGLWPYSRATEDGPNTACWAQDDSGNKMYGVNFASQDYLSLSSHSAIKATAKETIERCGVHSAGSPALVGNTSYSVALERRIADFLKMEEVVLYPTGWAAGFGVIKGLVRSADHVVMDMLSHSCLQEGASAATTNVHLFRHLDNDYCRKILTKIRAKDKENGILVVTEGLFSMDSDTPDLAALQALCHEFNATLVVDVAHDLGCLGEDGRGHIGIQNMLGKVDVVMGSFSKTFGSNGGFVACKTPSGEGISPLLQCACDILERAVAGSGGHCSQGIRHHRVHRRPRAAPGLDGQHSEPSPSVAGRRSRILRRSVRDRLRQDGNGRPCPSGQQAIARHGTDCEPGRIPGGAEGSRAHSDAGDGQPLGCRISPMPSRRSRPHGSRRRFSSTISIGRPNCREQAVA